jgi:hypothetical protein
VLNVLNCGPLCVCSTVVIVQRIEHVVIGPVNQC